MGGVSASVNLPLPLHHKVQKFSSGTGSPRWSQKKGCKTVVVVVVVYVLPSLSMIPIHKLTVAYTELSNDADNNVQCLTCHVSVIKR